MRRAVAFLTPFGGAVTPDARTMRWFPLVGVLIGAGVGGVWWVGSKWWAGLFVPAVLAVIADLACTGMLHVDGLADTADGVLPHLERERRLVVMAQPDVGAFGVAAVAAVLLLRTASLASLHPHVLLIAGIWCASRAAMVLVPAVVPYARAGGLASAFLGDDHAVVVWIGAVGIVAGCGLAGIAIGWPAAAAMAALVGVAALVVAAARVRLGGFTGDVLGAVGVLGETAALLVASARW